MIKFRKNPNVLKLLKHFKGNKNAVLNEIRHKYTNYNSVQNYIYASENASEIFGEFYLLIGKQYPELRPVLVEQYRKHIKRIGE